VFSGPGQRALTRMPSLACTIANSLDIAKTAPFDAVSAVSEAQSGDITGELRRRGADYCDHTRSINDTSSLAVLLHTQNGILAPPPHSFNINTVRQIPKSTRLSMSKPNLLLSIQRIIIVRMHYPRIIKHHINPPTENILRLRDHSLYLPLLTHVAGEPRE
jgi:hypothetical protein